MEIISHEIKINIYRYLALVRDTDKQRHLFLHGKAAMREEVSQNIALDNNIVNCRKGIQMPESSLWTIVISSIFLSIGLSLRLAFFAHRLQLADKEIDRFIEKIESIKQEHEKTIMGLSELQEAERKKIIEYFNISIQEIRTKLYESDYIQKAPETRRLALAKALKKYRKPTS